MCSEWAGRLRFNAFTLKRELDGRELDDPDITETRLSLEQITGRSFGKDIVFDALCWVCRKNQYDPLIDYLNGLEWDGISRVDTWLTDVYESAVLQASKEIRARKAEENRKRREELRESALSLAPPAHCYRTIGIDPSWPMQKIERDLRPDQMGFDSPAMSLEEIAAYPLPAADECHLYLWTTQKFLPAAFEILEARDFKRIV